MTWKKVETYIKGDVLHENKTTAMPHSRDFSHTSEWTTKEKSLMRLWNIHSGYTTSSHLHKPATQTS
jgi:hypothetical protein